MHFFFHRLSTIFLFIYLFNGFICLRSFSREGSFFLTPSFAIGFLHSICQRIFSHSSTFRILFFFCFLPLRPTLTLSLVVIQCRYTFNFNVSPRSLSFEKQKWSGWTETIINNMSFLCVTNGILLLLKLFRHCQCLFLDGHMPMVSVSIKYLYGGTRKSSKSVRIKILSKPLAR